MFTVGRGMLVRADTATTDDGVGASETDAVGTDGQSGMGGPSEIIRGGGRGLPGCRIFVKPVRSTLCTDDVEGDSTVPNDAAERLRDRYTTATNIASECYSAPRS